MFFLPTYFILFSPASSHHHTMSRHFFTSPDAANSYHRHLTPCRQLVPPRRGTTFTSPHPMPPIRTTATSPPAVNFVPPCHGTTNHFTPCCQFVPPPILCH